MKRSILCLLSLLAVGIAAEHSQADYPIASHRYLADPSCLVTDDRVYIYCSNDDESPVEGSYNIPNVICVSTSDLKNWCDHGSVFRAADATTWAKKTWAPAAIERDGKFFLYFGNGGANIGVAVSEHPTGPFVDALGKPLITHGTPGVQPAKEMWLFDPGVFVDDDGQAYIYFGGNGDDNVRGAKLGRDMISLDGDVQKMNAKNFFEAAWVFKRDGTYFFTYSTTPRAGMRIDYMTSNHPIQDYTYAGIVADQPPINNNNNHSSQFRFKDHWYHVYHNRVVAKQAGIPTGFRRNLAIEEMHFDDAGTIAKVAYTENGVSQLGHLNPYDWVEAETFHAQSGVETEPCSAGGMNLTELSNGDWVKIVGVDFGSQGAQRFLAMAASDAVEGALELRLDDPANEVLCRCRLADTGGWQAWKEFACDVPQVSGIHDLYLTFAGQAERLPNLDSWKFEQ